MNHIERALQLAGKYERAGNKELADKFFKIAEKYEKFLEGERKKDEERKQI